MDDLDRILEYDITKPDGSKYTRAEFLELSPEEKNIIFDNLIKREERDYQKDLEDLRRDYSRTLQDIHDAREIATPSL